MFRPFLWWQKKTFTESLARNLGCRVAASHCKQTLQLIYKQTEYTIQQWNITYDCSDEGYYNGENIYASISDLLRLYSTIWVPRGPLSGEFVTGCLSSK